MRFLYVCDIHGDKDKYNKILEIAKKNNIKYLVWGGDILPKKMGVREEVQPVFIDSFFDEYLSLLYKNDMELIFIMGNDDLDIFDDKINDLCDKYPNVHNINKTKYTVGDCEFIGLSEVLDNPFRYKNRVVMEDGLEMEPQICEELWVNHGKDRLTVEEWKEYRETKLERMKKILQELPEMDNSKKTIYVFHAPPYGVGLDECRGGYKAGSKDMAEFLKNSHAYMSFHGHIHESPNMSGKWHNKLGETICIQPGQTERGEEQIIYAIVDTDNDSFERYTLNIKQ